MMSLWDALRMNMMISYQELVRTFPSEMSGYAAFFPLYSEAGQRPARMDLSLLPVDQHGKEQDCCPLRSCQESF
ncbi:hypothetical protein DMQ00_29175 [Klebsiella pneumoniae]|nr:hypothetical protein DMQ00_29175 [Klebsiella pneumoniae]